MPSFHNLGCLGLIEMFQKYAVDFFLLASNLVVSCSFLLATELNYLCTFGFLQSFGDSSWSLLVFLLISFLPMQGTNMQEIKKCIQCSF